MEKIRSFEPISGESSPVDGFRFNSQALCEAFDFIRKNDERFRGASVEDFAEAADLSVSTLKKLKQGAIADPRSSSVWQLCKTFALDSRVLLGLAPERDYQKEAETFNPTIMESMRQQVAAMEQQRAGDAAELDRLRKLVLSKGEAGSCADERVRALEAVIRDREQSIARRDASIRSSTEMIESQNARLEAKAEQLRQMSSTVSAQAATIEANMKTISNLEKINYKKEKTVMWLSIAICIMVLTLISACAYFAWEVLNLDEGVTSIIYKELLENLEALGNTK